MKWVLLFFCLIGPAFASGGPKKFDAQVKVQDRIFFVQVAQTPEEWHRGLMYVNNLADNQGMFFWGETDKVQSFWMKNTSLALDIIFIDRDFKIVHIEKEAVPFSTNSRSSLKPARHVLEIRGGLSDHYGFKTGDRVVFNRGARLLPGTKN